MKNLIFIMLVTIALGACSPLETSNKDESKNSSKATMNQIADKIDLEQLDKVQFIYNNKAYDAKYKLKCKTSSECSEGNDDLRLDKIKKEIKPKKINANIGDQIEIRIPNTFPAPDQILYEQQQGATGIQETVDKKVIEVTGDKGEEITYIVNFNWRSNDNDNTKIIYSVAYYFEVPDPT
ncbi:hypothetical protein SAMN05216353_102136 [Halobacillus alkaliphilus]|uniref:Lipoprotein n=1 Tax=Halobacillus alkaliphilus TaxID=396056 RepID=A0A1I2JV29_9BACI|nr:hypothetical protein [Halobacillus alkaliphilus]SFF57953.1 hypothetical protein SAMN05216353_102136 [Halobacillus alkaliphilus]